MNVPFDDWISLYNMLVQHPFDDLSMLKSLERMIWSLLLSSKSHHHTQKPAYNWIRFIRTSKTVNEYCIARKVNRKIPFDFHHPREMILSINWLWNYYQHVRLVGEICPYLPNPVCLWQLHALPLKAIGLHKCSIFQKFSLIFPCQTCIHCPSLCRIHLKMMV